ncbi:LppX_LprAFG lipoprotein [Sphaerisporangium sp. B11E5]|uniref:LppX_LprAFG lipoprotein n=1 Tax=Sphaerisporangium sp. B11E5 TaxID=3153563 RepID=UPI00325EEEA3
MHTSLAGPRAPVRPHRRGRPRLTAALGWLLAALLVTVLTGAACTSAPPQPTAAPLPDGGELLRKSAQAMGTVKTVGFTIETDGKPPVPVQHAEGSLTKEADAQGTLRMNVFGTLQEMAFVLIGDKVYFKGPTGGYQTMTRQQLAALYDPSAILNPDKGVSHLLSTATAPKTEAEETVDGVAAYRVAAQLPQPVVAALIPGVDQAVNAKLWVDKATGRLLKASLPLGDGATAGTVTVTFSDYDKPVEITAPAT